MKKKIYYIFLFIFMFALFSGMLPVIGTAAKVDYSEIISQTEEVIAESKKEYLLQVRHRINLLNEVLQGKDSKDAELRDFLNNSNVTKKEIQLMINQLSNILESKTFSLLEGKTVDKTVEFLEENNMPNK